MRRLSLASLLLACVLLCGCGPRMAVQPAIRPYEQQMPDMPADTVPTTGGDAALTAKESRAARNPLPPTATNTSNGRIYYEYYCRMCHGKLGDGNGPVGQSFVPRPTDLSSPRVTRMTDGQLYLRMLTGTGHDPVLRQTVPSDHRWPIVLYVRAFARKP